MFQKFFRIKLIFIYSEYGSRAEFDCGD